MPLSSPVLTTSAIGSPARRRISPDRMTPPSIQKNSEWTEEYIRSHGCTNVAVNVALYGNSVGNKDG
jgi:hypothetical protein